MQKVRSSEVQNWPVDKQSTNRGDVAGAAMMPPFCEGRHWTDGNEQVVG